MGKFCIAIKHSLIKKVRTANFIHYVNSTLNLKKKKKNQIKKYYLFLNFGYK